MKHLFFPLFAVLFLSACNSIEHPTLERIEDVTINEVNTKLLDVDAIMILHNPNPYALDLASADFTASIDNVELAKITQSYDTSMPANSDFKMPITIKMNLENLYNGDPLMALSKGLKIMSDKKVDVHFLGNIKIGKGSAKISVPVDKIENIEF